MTASGSLEACPLCGTVPSARADRDAVAELTREVARLREVAEATDQARLEELDREVRLLRETVARLRGSLGNQEQPLTR